MLQSHIKFLIIIPLLFFARISFGQITTDTIAENDSLVSGAFGFVNYEADTITHSKALSVFFDKLLSLENNDSTTVSILHIGDSHIQADFITRELRKNLQLKFGNAGRGLVFPLRAAGTNEPNDIKSSAAGDWTTGKIINQAPIPKPGISAIAMQTLSSGSSIELSTLNHDELDYSFNQVVVLHQKDSLQFDFRAGNSPQSAGYLMSAQDDGSGIQATEVTFEKPANYLKIAFEQTEIQQQQAVFYGISLTNNKPGVLYHSAGINGAHFTDYLANPLFFNQIKIIKPDLVIISLGTNEGADIKITENQIRESVHSMIQLIRDTYPSAAILLTTPADDYFHKKYKNAYLETVQRAIVNSANAEKTALWDLYSITGGYGSCTEWRSAGLLQRDGVHYTKGGYILQGSLLFQALTDSYVKYATN